MVDKHVFRQQKSSFGRRKTSFAVFWVFTRTLFKLNVQPISGWLHQRVIASNHGDSSITPPQTPLVGVLKIEFITAICSFLGVMNWLEYWGLVV